MRRLAVLLLCFSALFPLGCDQVHTPRPLPPIEVYFSPKGGCTDAIVNEISAARLSLLIQAYSFTSAPIAKAVVDAQKKGIHVEVVLDRSNKTDKYSAADFVHNAGIPILIDSEHPIAHNKIMIIDGQVVITGSFNFTKQAEQGNAENLLVIRDKTLADQYTANWKLHADHSEPYTRKNPE
jgi:phosphatidylserine/phosphatidylglycerophosphate/cardiolipin synthase-like enzyme